MSLYKIECGPQNLPLSEQLAKVAALKSTFSESGWNYAKHCSVKGTLEECLPAGTSRCGLDQCVPTVAGCPTWPPKTDNGFSHPQMDKPNLSVLVTPTPEIPIEQQAKLVQCTSLECTGPMFSPRKALCEPDFKSPLDSGCNSCVTSDDYLYNRIVPCPAQPVATCAQQPQSGSCEADPTFQQGGPRNASQNAPQAVTQPISRDVAVPLVAITMPVSRKGGLPIAAAFSSSALRSVPPLMLNTINGIVYDLQHFENLPGKGIPEKLNYVFMRDDRILYIILWVIVITIGILLLVLLIQAILGA